MSLEIIKQLQDENRELKAQIHKLELAYDDLYETATEKNAQMTELISKLEESIKRGLH